MVFLLINYAHKETEYDSNGSNSSTPQPPSSPSLSDNLAIHPYFRSEFSLPIDNYIDSLIVARRTREAESPPSSPARSSSAPVKPKTRKRKASKADLAGLVSGDSESSDLTVESAEEDEFGKSPSAKRGVSDSTGTDVGTEELQEDTNGKHRK